MPWSAEETRRSLSKRCWRLSHVMNSCPRVPQGEPATWGHGSAVCLFVGYFPVQSLALRCPMIPFPSPFCPAQVKKGVAYTLASLPFRGSRLVDGTVSLQLLRGSLEHKRAITVCVEFTYCRGIHEICLCFMCSLFLYFLKVLSHAVKM